MAAIILGWNPEIFPVDEWVPPYSDVVEQTHAGYPFDGRWSVGNHVNIPVGAAVWLYLQGMQHGLVGRGVVTSEPYTDEHFSNPTKTTNYVEVSYKLLVPLNDAISRDLLEAEVPEVHWRKIYSSGYRVPVQAENALRDLWFRSTAESRHLVDGR